MEPAKADREYPLGEIIIKTGKESQKHMVDTRTDELYRALQDKGYPDELCREILSDREAIVRKKELEHAQATINSVYREGL